MESTHCNLCGSSLAEPLYSLPDLLMDCRAPLWRLVRCRACGLVYQDPRPTQAEIGQYYPPEYDSYRPRPRAGFWSWLSVLAADYGLAKRCRVVQQYKPAGRLLDVGCASGSFLYAMRSRPGWQVAGVEVSPHAAQAARQNFGLEVYNGQLAEAAFPGAYFDAVTFWDVLEHLHDPAASLAEVARVLKPDGILVVRVPNLDSREARWFGPSWSGLDVPRHLYVFDRQTLVELLARHGFTLLHLDSRLGSYSTFVLSVRFWLTARRASPGLRRLVEFVIGNPVARLLAAPFFFFTSRSAKGPVITAIFEKRRTEKIENA